MIPINKTVSWAFITLLKEYADMVSQKKDIFRNMWFLTKILLVPIAKNINFSYTMFLN